MKRRSLALLLAAALVFSLAGCSSGTDATEGTAAGTQAPTTGAETEEAAEAAGGYTAGTYTGTSTGMNGDVTVEVTFDEDSITAITVTNQSETYGIGQGLNYMEYNNEEADALLKEMRTVADYQERIKLLDQWQQLWVEEVPRLMTHVPVQTFVANTTNFAGFETTFGYLGYLGCAQLCQVYQL